MSDHPIHSATPAEVAAAFAPDPPITRAQMRQVFLRPDGNRPPLEPRFVDCACSATCRTFWAWAAGTTAVYLSCSTRPEIVRIVGGLQAENLERAMLAVLDDVDTRACVVRLFLAIRPYLPGVC